MAIFKNAKTIGSEVQWKSPDGQRTIHKISMDINGDSVAFKTFSDVIAEKDWQGDVESYEKQGKQGVETFVKQAPKEEGFTPHPTTSGRFTADPFTMYLSYAKDVVVAQIAAMEFGGADTTDLLDKVLVGGYQLYNNRPDAPKQVSLIDEED